MAGSASQRKRAPLGLSALSVQVTVSSTRAAGMEAEVVDFRVPVESNKTVLVWDIPPTFGEAHIHVSAHTVTSFCIK